MQQANLIIRPEKLGDLVVATPVFRAIRESFPDQPLHLLTDDIYADAVRHDPHLDKIIPVRWKLRSRGNHEPYPAIYRKLKETRYQRAAILYANCEGLNWLVAALRIPEVAQIGGTVAAYLFGHKQVRRKGNYERVHYSQYYLRVAAQLGARASDEAPTLYVLPEEIADLRKRYPLLQEKKKRVIVHPFGHGSAPICSLKAYAETMELLCRDPAIEVFVTGTPNERTLWEPYRHLPVRTDWLGTLNIRDWMAAVSQVDLMIGGATGVTHVAAALQRPVLGLYCPHIGTHPEIWGPMGKNSHLLIVPENLCRAIQTCDSPCAGNASCDLSFALKPTLVAQKAFSILNE